jgi:serine/threonine-protein kinase
MSPAAGTKLGRYEIRSKIGAGGMGEVYLAQDTELDRTVAIKILPESVAADPQRLQRFVQEAKAASALNHPHILTIYEIGAAGAVRFIATEFIDGETLRPRIAAGMTLAEILEIVIQTAAALSAAHEAGIIHRDVKPENIMVRRDGYIKLLDFGLAKLAGPGSSVTDPEAPTRALLNTDAGTVMGTANYMSPEQAKGTSVDARTDLWSLGSVLYEMVAGQLPFASETPTETISLILQREPPPLTRYAPAAPAELERIVTKTLTKNRDERYQTAKDLLVDLRNLKRKLELDAEIERTTPPEKFGPSDGRVYSGQLSPLSGTPNTATAGTPSTHPASNAEYLVSGIKQHKTAAAAIAGVVLIALVVGAFGVRRYLQTPDTRVAIDSIAVLPFENQSRDPETEYLTDGVTESIINSLTRLPNLKVTARSSVFRYKGRETDPFTIGKELGVRAVLTGRLLQRGDNLLISVELTDVRDNKQLWGQRYERKTSDLLAVQRDIAREITGNLQLELSGADQARLNKPNTDNPESYRLYLKGRYYADRLTKEGFEKGIESITQAIELDPNYALAYVGLSNCYFQAVDLSIAPREGMPKAKAAVLKAIALDDTLAEAHVGLANILWQYDWDWPAAEREFKRAIELNPNHAGGHIWYGFYLAVIGRFDESVAEEKKAQELDPLEVFAFVQMGVTLHFARRYDQAIDQARQAIKMDPNFWLPHVSLGRAYEQKGQLAEAIAEYEKAREIDANTPEVLMDLGRAYAVAGRRAEAERILAELKARTKTGYVSPFHIAMVYIGLGDKEQAFAALEQAYEARSWYMTWLKTAPEFNSLRSDPRFADLVRRVGLPQ